MDVLAPAQPELRAKGFIINSVEPAWPIRSSLPAYPETTPVKIAVVVKIREI
jgi:hypothetical protein